MLSNTPLTLTTSSRRSDWKSLTSTGGLPSGDLFDNDEEITKLYLSLMTEEKPFAAMNNSMTRDISCIWDSLEPTPMEYSSSSSSSNSSTSSASTVPTSAPRITTTSSAILPSWNPATAPIESKPTSEVALPVVVVPPFTTPPQPGFVSVYLMVDPLNQIVTMPRQTLHYENQTLNVEETKLPSFPKKAIELFTRQVILQQQQQQAQLPLSSKTSLPVDIAKNQYPSPQTTSLQGSHHAHHVVSTKEETSSHDVNDDSSHEVPTGGQPLRPDTNAALPPLRALSAYNYFFRDERERLLQNPDGDEPVVVRDLTPAKQQKLLADHWCRDRVAKRPHRKSHGKISFAELSRRISSSWKRLKTSDRAFYKTVAAKDWDRYQREVRELAMLSEVDTPATVVG